MNAERRPLRDFEEPRSRNLPLPGLDNVAPVTIVSENLNEKNSHKNEDDLLPAYDELFQTS